MKSKSYVIALEEHYQDTELRQHTGGSVAERLEDVGGLRLKEMDEAGIDLQVLSHANPGLQGVDAAIGVPLARRINDRLHEAVQRHPDRLAAFAAVPTADPKAAADELERTVTRLGFKGAMINGLTGGMQRSPPAETVAPVAVAEAPWRQSVEIRSRSPAPSPLTSPERGPALASVHSPRPTHRP
jgi:predicted TIM-barrel fold metal-dependent hydrolase